MGGVVGFVAFCYPMINKREVVNGRMEGFLIRSPGSCGELVQGVAGGEHFLVTCPVAIYAEAGWGRLLSGTTAMPDKVCRALALFRSQFAPERTIPRFQLRSQLPQGKGMASSSADIAVALAATAKQWGVAVTPHDLCRLAAAVEPTDAVFVPGIVQFNHRRGRVLQQFGAPPLIRLLIFDVGGKVDTVSFNRRPDLEELNRAKEEQVAEALALLEQGLDRQEAALIGRAATISSRANQQILPKQPLEELIAISRHFGAVGVNIAHSGTVIGLLFPAEADLPACRETVLRRCPAIGYLCETRLISGGLEYWEEDKNEWLGWR